MKTKFILIVLAVLVHGFTFSQSGKLEPKVSQAVYFDVTPPLSQMRLIPPDTGKKELTSVPNKIGKKEFGNLQVNQFPFAEDALWQKQDGTVHPLMAGPIQNFDGITNISGYYPPDTQGDVGPDKYIQVVNVSFAIYSKTGGVLLGPALLSTIWAGMPAPWNGTNDGDPVVLYDQAADRWIITQFSLPFNNNAELIAISQTGDPTGAWYRYIFNFGTTMPDYPKFGVWPDGYYMAVNRFLNNGNAWGGVGACAFERTKMLAGNAGAQMIQFTTGVANNDPASMLPSDWDGTITPQAGEPNHFTFFDDWSAADDFLKIWDFHVDWTTPANSTFTQVSALVCSPSAEICGYPSNGNCIAQPGTAVKLASLSDRLMYRLQYRNFGTHRSMVTNHTVDLNGSSHAGIRWYELRNTGAGWLIYQQGTYGPDAANRWMGSIAMNSAGDIALGYSVSDGTSIYPGIRYTGRKAGDALGVMTVAEQSIIAGSGNQTGPASRWGDYSMMAVDPSDDQTFWYTTEYVQISGQVNWKTRIASFKFLNAPSATTLPAYAITTTSATLSGTVNPNTVATNYHFEYGTTVAYGSSTPTISAGSGSTPVAVSAGISGLITGTPIHYRVVAVNGEGTTNGDDLTFIPGGAVLTTTTPSGVLLNTASSGGNITADGGSAVTLRGVCWSTSANPTTTDIHSTDGSGVGSFTSSLTGLSANTIYHVRAYAINGTGTFYGEDLTFSTLCGIYSLPFYEGFASVSIPVCWTQVDHMGNGQVWQFGTITGYASLNPLLTGNYAYLNSDGYGNGNSQNADLVSPLLDLTAYATINLSFNHYFRSYSSSAGTLSYSLDNGTNWVVIQSFASTTNPESFSQSVPAVAGQAQVKFKWNFVGDWAWYWAIDDIQLTGLPINRQLSNIIVPAGSTNCYNASQTITVAGSGTTFLVNSSGNATLIAGLKVDILPGATVQPGGYLRGYIAPAGPFCVNPTFLPRNPEISLEKSTDLDNATVGEMFKVYPNPTTGKFMLELTGVDLTEKIRVEIYNMRGGKIQSKEITAIKTNTFSLTDAPAGLYFVRVVTFEKAETLKIIKSK